MTLLNARYTGSHSGAVTMSVVVTATTADGESVCQAVIVSVTGADDVPVITGTTTGAVDEDGTLAATGTLSSNDPDTGDTLTFTPQPGSAGSFGTFVFDASGAWKLTIRDRSGSPTSGQLNYWEVQTAAD